MRKKNIIEKHPVKSLDDKTRYLNIKFSVYRYLTGIFYMDFIDIDTTEFKIASKSIPAPSLKKFHTKSPDRQS